jgi:hypothetical protein
MPLQEEFDKIGAPASYHTVSVFHVMKDLQSIEACVCSLGGVKPYRAPHQMTDRDCTKCPLGLIIRP